MKCDFRDDFIRFARNVNCFIRRVRDKFSPNEITGTEKKILPAEKIHLTPKFFEWKILFHLKPEQLKSPY